MEESGCFSQEPKARFSSTAPTSKHLGDLAQAYLNEIGKKVGTNPRLVLGLWSEIVGAHIAPMTKATRFENSVLYVLVRNSTLLSLLHRKDDKERLVRAFQSRAPGINISDIVFRLG